MTREEMKNEAKRLAVVYDGWRMNQELFDVWCECLGPCKYPLFKKAVSEYIANSEFPPTPAGVMKYYRPLAEADKALNRRIRQEYDLARSAYPNPGDEDSDFAAYVAYIRSFPEERREKAADALTWEVLDYAGLSASSRDRQDGSAPTFAEFLKGKAAR